VKQKEFLFSLIKSLTKHEKKYFVGQARANRGDKNYLRLYEIIERQDVYDEQKVRAAFKGEKFLRQLPVAKNYLGAGILRALRAYHAAANVERELKEELHEVEILYAKSLYRHCRQKLARIVKKAKLHEKHVCLLEALSWQKKLERIQGYKQMNAATQQALFKEELHTIELLRDDREYDALSDDYFLLIARGHNAKSELNGRLRALLNSKLLRDERRPQTYRSKNFFHLIRSRIQHNLGDLEAGCEHGKKQLALLEALPARLFEEERFNYIVASYNQLIILTYLKRNAEFEAGIAKLRRLEARNEKERSTLFYTYLTELDYYIVNRRYTQGCALEAPIAEGLKTFEGKLNRQVELAFCYNLGYAFIGAGRAKKALRWLNKILNDEAEIRTDIHAMARLLNLLAHYELGNDDTLSHLAGSATRYLRKHDFFGKIEALLLDYLGKKLPNASNERARQTLLKKLQEELNAFPGKEGESFRSMFDFPRWIESRLQNKSMEDR